MSVLAGLKLIAAKQKQEANPTLQRRLKLIAKLDEQIALAKATAEGMVYTPMRSRRVKDAAGNVSVVKQPKRLKAWFWPTDAGKICVTVRYGNRVVELSKGRTAVETSAAELTGTLGLLRKAIESGEIDAQLEAVSTGVRRGFKRQS